MSGFKFSFGGGGLIGICLLLLTIQNCQASLSLWTGLQGTGDRTNFMDIGNSCWNLPKPFQEQIVSASTTECVLLHPQKNCGGRGFILYNGHLDNLFSFNNRTISFQSCSAANVTAPDVSIYRDEVFRGPMLQFKRIPTTCQNIPYGQHKSDRRSIRTNKCIQIFSSDFNCLGRSRQYNAGNHSYFLYDPVKSFRACSIYDSEQEYHTKFYNGQDVIEDIAIQPECSNVHLMRNTTVIETRLCVRLYEDYDCKNEHIHELQTGRHSAETKPEVFPIQAFGINSMRPCNNDDVVRSITPVDASEVASEENIAERRLEALALECTEKENLMEQKLADKAQQLEEFCSTTLPLCKDSIIFTNFTKAEAANEIAQNELSLRLATQILKVICEEAGHQLCSTNNITAATSASNEQLDSEVIGEVILMSQS